MKVDEYRTTQEVKVKKDTKEYILPPLAFVKPIEFKWLPKHVQESPEHRWFSKELEMFVYCRYGIVCIKKEFVRKVD